MIFKKSILSLLLGIGLMPPLWADETIVTSENVLQAALLYNFALFTEWPEPFNRHFNICVMASTPVYEALQPFKAKQVRGQPVVITLVESAAQALSCQILFIGKSEHASIKSLAREIKPAPILVVAEENSFDPKSVIITLVPQQGRIGFKINHSSAQAISLTISSKLLKLAQHVF